EADSEIDFSHPGDCGGFSKKRRRQRSTVPDVVALVREVLDVHEQLESITGSSRIERAHLRRGATAKHADNRRLSGGPPECKDIPDICVDRRLTTRSQGVSANAGGAIVEDAVAVIVATAEDRVRRGREGIQVEAQQDVAHDLIVEGQIQAAANIAS